MRLGHWLCALAAFAVVFVLLVEGLGERPGRGPRSHDSVFREDRDGSRRRFGRDALASQEPHPVALWGIDDAWNIVPLAPDLVRRGRVVAMPWGWTP